MPHRELSEKELEQITKDVGGAGATSVKGIKAQNQRKLAEGNRICKQPSTFLAAS